MSSYAFGCRAPERASNQIGGGSVPVELPFHRFGLAEAIGISSVSFAYFMDSMPTWNALIPTMDLWPVTSNESPNPEPARKFMLGDGATLDDLSINVNLQRKVARVAAFFSTGIVDKIVDQSVFDFCTQFDPLKFDYKGKISVAISSYFGYGDSNDRYDYTRNTVFKSEDLGPFACVLQKRIAAGHVAVVWLPLEVQANRWWGIQGGWVVNLLVSYGTELAEFESQLPEDTRCELNKRAQPHSALRNFPYYRLTAQNAIFNLADSSLSRPQINLLTAQGEYSLITHQELYRKFLGGAAFDPAYNEVTRVDPTTRLLKKATPPLRCKENGAWWKWLAGAGAVVGTAVVAGAGIAFAMHAKHKQTVVPPPPANPCLPGQLWDAQTWKELHLSGSFQRGQLFASTWLLPLLCVLMLLCGVVGVSRLVRSLSRARGARLRLENGSQIHREDGECVELLRVDKGVASELQA